MKFRRLATIGLLSAGLFITNGCISGSSLPPPIKAAAKVNAEYVANNIEQPSALAAADDGRVFFTEKNTGRIRVIKAGVLLDTPFAEVPVNSAGDRGLIGIALHPDFARNGRVYIFYTRSDTGETTDDSQAVIDNRVVYFIANGDVADGGEVFVASLPAGSTTSHVGGRIAFDNNKKLYVALGDFGEDAAPQADDALGGKVLRYNDDGGVPDDNPTANSAIFARGLRDIHGAAVDGQSNVLFVVDLNSGGNNEIDRIASGFNYGWPTVVGEADTSAERDFADNTTNYADPIIDTKTENPVIAGVTFNAGAKYGPDAQSEMFYAEGARGRIQRVRLAGDRIAVEGRKVFAENFPKNIRDIAFTPTGTLYVACDSAIFRCAPVQ